MTRAAVDSAATDSTEPYLLTTFLGGIEPFIQATPYKCMLVFSVLQVWMFADGIKIRETDDS